MSWLSAQSYCESIGGNLPVLRHWEHLYHINAIAKPLPVYIGVTEVIKHINRLLIAENAVLLLHVNNGYEWRLRFDGLELRFC